MGKMTNLVADTDFQLLSLLVRRILEEDGLTGVAPAANDYVLVKSRRFRDAVGELEVPVQLGRGAVARIFTLWDGDPKGTVDFLVPCAKEIAEKIADLHRDSPALRSILSEARAATKREIAKAARRGLPIELTSVEFERMEAGFGFEGGVKVEFTALSEALRPEAREFFAESREHVAEAFSELVVQQTNRAIRREELDLIGATGMIDAVVVAALEAAGLDLRDVLTQLRDSEDWIVDVPRPEGGRFVLHWKEGRVRAQIQLAEGVSWHKGALHFRSAPRAMDKLAWGTPLSKVFDHPFFAPGQSVTSGWGSKGGHATVNSTETMLAFDADSGRLWAA